MNTDDDLFADMVADITLDVLAKIGDDPDARYAFFKRFVELAKQTVSSAAGSEVGRIQ